MNPAVPPSMRRLIVTALMAPCLALVACDPAPTTESPPSTAPAPSPSTIDPLVPYSPATTPLQEITSGFAGDTLTLPATDGGPIQVKLVNTALPFEFADDGTRPFSVYLTLTNAGDDTWSGIPGQGARVTDAAGGYNEAQVNPDPADLHPKPQRLGVSNTNLMQQVDLEPGETIDGMLLFITGGGNRPVTVSVTFDEGQTQGSWLTSMGPS